LQLSGPYLQELDGARFYAVTYGTLAATYFVALNVPSIWVPLQLIGSTAGAWLTQTDRQTDSRHVAVHLPVQAGCQSVCLPARWPAGLSVCLCSTPSVATRHLAIYLAWLAPTWRPAPSCQGLSLWGSFCLAIYLAWLAPLGRPARCQPAFLMHAPTVCLSDLAGALVAFVFPGLLLFAMMGERGQLLDPGARSVQNMALGAALLALGAVQGVTGVVGTLLFRDQ
jgi:hypothetical protein